MIYALDTNIISFIIKGNEAVREQYFIAAQCISNGYVLVTNNTKHFHDISGLEIIDWTH